MSHYRAECGAIGNCWVSRSLPYFLESWLLLSLVWSFWGKSRRKCSLHPTLSGSGGDSLLLPAGILLDMGGPAGIGRLGGSTHTHTQRIERKQSFQLPEPQRNRVQWKWVFTPCSSLLLMPLWWHDETFRRMRWSWQTPAALLAFPPLWLAQTSWAFRRRNEQPGRMSGCRKQTVLTQHGCIFRFSAAELPPWWDVSPLVGAFCVFWRCETQHGAGDFVHLPPTGQGGNYTRVPVHLPLRSVVIRTNSAVFTHPEEASV